MEHRDAPFRHQLPVLRLRPHAVGSHATGASPHAVSIQHLEGGQTAVTSLALLVLRLGLRHMDVHPQMVLAGVACQVVPQIGGEEGGVFPVNGEVDFDLTVVDTIPLFRQGDGLLTGDKGGRVVQCGEHSGAPGQVQIQTSLQSHLCHVVTEIIHIRKGGDAACDHLRHAQRRTGADGLGGELVLHRENVLVQPGVQVVAAAVSAHEHHGHMAVGVDQTGHQYLLVLAVDDLVKVASGSTSGHFDNLTVFHNEIGVLQHVQILVHGDDGKVFEQCFHEKLLLVQDKRRRQPRMRAENCALPASAAMSTSSSVRG